MEKVRSAVTKMEPVANIVFRIAGVAAGLSLAYMLLAIFGGSAKPPTGTVTQAQIQAFAQVTKNLALASTIFNWALIFVALSVIILAFEERWIGLGIAGLGLVLAIGVPLMLSSALGNTGTGGRLGAIIVSNLVISTRVLLVLGLLKYAMDMVQWLIELPERMKQRASVGVGNRAEAQQQRIAKGANMFSPCWSLPYCREVIRKQCPAYLAKKRCWKFGRGCYCDEEMISRIIRGESLDVIKAPTRMSRQGKPPCDRCYIFIEHQSLKFKALSPLAVPLTIVGMFLIWQPYTVASGFILKNFDVILSKMSFSTANPLEPTAAAVEEAKKYQINTDQVVQYGQVMFGILLGFLLLIYISKFLEWAVFKAKL